MQPVTLKNPEQEIVKKKQAPVNTSFETFVLLDICNSTAPIFQVVEDPGGGPQKRIQLKRPVVEAPYLQITFQDDEGYSKTIRYKANSDTIDLKEQIAMGIEANEKFTTPERQARVFRNGILVTNKENLKKYLKAYPGCEGFTGTCDDVREPFYKLLDRATEARISNSEIKLRLAAMNKVFAMDSLEQLQSLMIRLNGSFFSAPDNIEDCQNELVGFIDNAEEDGLKSVLKGDAETTVDEQATILLGQLLNANLLSFDAVKGTISKKGKDGKWMAVRDMADSYPIEERKRLFSDFLNSEDGKPLKEDLQKDLLKYSSKPNSKN